MAGDTNQSLQDAINEFQAALTSEQKTRLQVIKAVPDFNAVLTFTAKLDEENAQRQKRCVTSRLITLLRSVQQFSAVVDTFVASNPAIAALVWGSVKLTVLASLPNRPVKIDY
jgi:hypothetical protein